MDSANSSPQTTLLTAHKGVDLHAASALLVMKDRLEGGDQLVNLYRCELHAFWGEPAGWSGDRLLDTGRFFNPNKHHYGLFLSQGDGADWFTAEDSGHCLPSGWAGTVQGTDLEALTGDGAAHYEALLGGALPDGCAPCDIVGFARGQEGPVLSGVLWRLVVRGDEETAAAVGEKLAVARHRKQGLLINPHMDSWFATAR